MNFSDYVIFADESGDHSLAPIDGAYPVFVLDFCIFRKDYFANTIVPKVQMFKFKHFGHDMVVLHEHDIRKQKPPFVFLQNREKREAFMNGLSALIDGAEFTIVATVIDKHRYARTHLRPENPYELALKFCMERAHSFLRDRRQHTRTTHIVVERRGKREDDELELAFRRVLASSSFGITMPKFEIAFADKKTNSIGLQLADLTARPIGRHAMNPEQPNRAWDIIERKLHRNPAGETAEWGLKVFP